MMKKKCNVAALLAIGMTTSVALASNDRPVTVFAELVTDNDSLVNGSPMQLAEVLGFQQSFSKHFYYALSATVPQHSAYTLEADIGLQTTYHGFSPFVELEGTTSHDGNNHFTENLDYDFGMSYQLTKVISPKVAFDSMGLNNNASLKYGAGLQLSKKVSMGLYALKFLKHDGSSGELQLAYTI